VRLSLSATVDLNSPQARLTRGHLLRRLAVGLPREVKVQVLGQALAELQGAKESGENSAPWYDDYGAVLESLGRASEAIAVYNQGLQLDPNHIKMRIKRGWVLVARGKYEEARSDFQYVTSRHPDHAEAQTGLGYTHACLKAPAAASDAAARALLCVSGGPDQFQDYLVLHNAACIYARLSATGDAQASEQQDMAMALLRRAVEIWRRVGPAHDELAEIRREADFGPLQNRQDWPKLFE
jgi:tetratricopeptide (TPR) repeat protein